MKRKTKSRNESESANRSPESTHPRKFLTLSLIAVLLFSSFAVLFSGTVKATSTSTIRTYTDPNDSVIRAFPSPDDSLVAMCTNSGNVYIYNVDDGTEIIDSPLNPTSGPIQGLAWSDDGNYLAVDSGGGSNYD